MAAETLFNIFKQVCSNLEKFLPSCDKDLLSKKETLEKEVRSVMSLYFTTSGILESGVTIVVNNKTTKVHSACQDILDMINHKTRFLVLFAAGKSIYRFYLVILIILFIIVLCVVVGLYFSGTKIFNVDACSIKGKATYVSLLTCLWLAFKQGHYYFVQLPLELDAICNDHQVLKKCKEAVVESLELKMETSPQLKLQWILHAWRAITDEMYVKAFLSATKSFFKGKSMAYVKKSKGVEEYTGDKYSSMYTIAEDLADDIKKRRDEGQSLEKIISAYKIANPIKEIQVVLPMDFFTQLLN